MQRRVPRKNFTDAAKQQERFAKTADALGDKEMAKEHRRAAKEYRNIAKNGPLPLADQ